MSRSLFVAAVLAGFMILSIEKEGQTRQREIEAFLLAGGAELPLPKEEMEAIQEGILIDESTLVGGSMSKREVRLASIQYRVAKHFSEKK